GDAAVLRSSKKMNSALFATRKNNQTESQGRSPSVRGKQRGNTRSKLHPNGHPGVSQGLHLLACTNPTAVAVVGLPNRRLDWRSGDVACSVFTQRARPVRGQSRRRAAPG